MFLNLLLVFVPSLLLECGWKEKIWKQAYIRGMRDEVIFFVSVMLNYSIFHQLSSVEEASFKINTAVSACGAGNFGNPSEFPAFLHKTFPNRDSCLSPPQME